MTLIHIPIGLLAYNYLRLLGKITIGLFPAFFLENVFLFLVTFILDTEISMISCRMIVRSFDWIVNEDLFCFYYNISENTTNV